MTLSTPGCGTGNKKIRLYQKLLVQPVGIIAIPHFVILNLRLRSGQA